jgi:serine/threonine protein phosphatase PrpC
MKAKINEEQRKYLTTGIGIPDKDIPPAGISMKKPTVNANSNSNSPVGCSSSSSRPLRSNSLPPFIVIIIILAALIILIKLAKGDDLYVLTDTNSPIHQSSPVSTSSAAIASIIRPSSNNASDHRGLLSREIGLPNEQKEVRSATAEELYILPHMVSSTGRSDHISPVVRSANRSLPVKAMPVARRGYLREVVTAVLTMAGCLCSCYFWFRRRLLPFTAKPVGDGSGGELSRAASDVASLPTHPPSDIPSEPHSVVSEHPAIGSPQPVWDVAVASHKGNVRRTNEDAAIAAVINGVQCLVVDDGCGGMPHGGIAARTASTEAMTSMAEDLARFPAWRRTDLMPIVERAIYRASVRLSIEAHSMGLSVTDMALRSTIIIVAGGIDAYVFGYLGDGAGYILRTDGRVESFLVPQYADPELTNVLVGSLGPWIEGRPVLGSLDRHAGELLIVTTDGISGFVSSDFPAAVASRVIRARGDLKSAAESVVNDLAQAKDENGWICSDNITIGLMTSAPISPGIIAPTRKVESSSPKMETEA